MLNKTTGLLFLIVFSFASCKSTQTSAKAERGNSSNGKRKQFFHDQMA